jgi:hypothetical protein
MHPQTARELGIKIQFKKEPYQLLTVDGTAISSDEGWVKRETGPLPMAISKHHEEITLDIAETGRHHVILGIPWLRTHNPRIEWDTDTIILTDCRCKIRKYEETTPQRLQKYAKKHQLGVRRVHFKEINNTEKRKSDITMSAYYATRYPDLWKTPDELPKHKSWDHAIPMEPGTKPPFGPIYQLSETELKALKEYIDENLKKGFIRPSQSPCGSPILFVPKKDGTLRLCVDYRGLNGITIKDRYPLPLINEIYDRLQGSKIFTKIDLQGAYNLVRIKEGEEWKTAFRTRYGHYEYTVMPFGLTNAPATFQAVMNDVLRHCLDKYAIAYLDDILVYSKTEEEHKKHVADVLQTLQRHDLRAAMKKTVFHQKEVEFLGYKIREGELSMDPSKLSGLNDWPTPSTVKEVQSFLGLCNYYRKFVQGYAQLALPLYELCKKDKKWQWENPQRNSFRALKDALLTEPVLKMPDSEKQFIVETDASDKAIGACLNQMDEVGHLHPCAFYSRKLTAPELNYDVHDKELLAIIEATREWRPYLAGARMTVQVYTDHKNLITFTTSKKLNRRQTRWAEMLADYDLRITYHEGRHNGRADALSRRPDHMEGHEEKEHTPLFIQGEKGELMSNHPMLSATVTMERTRLEQKFTDHYENDPYVKFMATNPERHMFSKKEGLWYFDGKIFVPSVKVQDVMREYHDHPVMGHQGTFKTTKRISEQYYFPRMHDQVKEYIKKCAACQKAKTNKHKPYGEMQVMEPPTKPWETITMDFITKLPPSKDPVLGVTYDSIWVIVDKLTKYAIFQPCREEWSTRDLGSQFLKDIVKFRGIPEQIITDRDVRFTSNYFQSMMKELKIKHKMSTAYHPQTDGQTERINQILETYLRMYLNYEQDNWVSLLPMAQLAYNGATTETTHVTPFFAFHGYPLNIGQYERTLDAISDDAQTSAEHMYALHDNLSKDLKMIALKQKKYYDQSRAKKTPDYEPGDKVYLLRRNIKTTRPSPKLDYKKLGPFRIARKTGPVNYRLALPQNMRIHPVFHVSLLEPAHPETPLANSDIEVREEEEHIPEEVLNSRNVNGEQQFLISWQDTEPWEATWEPASNLTRHRKLLQQYLRQASAAKTPRTTDRGAARRPPPRPTPRRLPTP